MEKKKYLVIIDFLMTVGCMIIATYMGILFRRMNITEANIIMVYILGVVIVAKYAKTQWGGIIASILGVLMFNYFFTDPYYSLAAHGAEYPITFLIMFAVAFITSTLTQKIKKEVSVSKERERYARSLYEVSHNLLAVKNLEETKIVSTVNIAKFLGKSVLMYPVNEKDEIEKPLCYDEDRLLKLENIQNLKDTIIVSQILKQKQRYYNKSNNTSYIPIKGQERILGIIGIRKFDFNTLSLENETLMNSVITQIALAFERENIALKQQELYVAVQSEKLKNNMLRAISHDLRTPLTGIVGATSTILKNQDLLDQKVKTQLLTGVYEDAIWLNHSVENILNITRIDDGRLIISKNTEVAEEVIESVLNRIAKNTKNHKIEVKLDKEFILVPMDANLIVQVLYNLIDNAIKYTPIGTIITLKVYKEKNKAIFEVIDNGIGIPQEHLKDIFKRFYRIHIKESINKGEKEEVRNGMGLGLPICKAIIQAHEGKINAFNNELGGATFRIELPMESGEKDGK